MEQAKPESGSGGQSSKSSGSAKGDSNHLKDSTLGGQSFRKGDIAKENAGARQEHHVDEENENKQEDRDKNPGVGDRQDTNRNKDAAHN